MIMIADNNFINSMKNKNHEKFYGNNGIRGYYRGGRKRSKRGKANRANWIWSRGIDEIFEQAQQEESDCLFNADFTRKPLSGKVEPIVFVHILWPKN